MRFNYRKATQALNWLAWRKGGAIGKLNAMKLVFLADRLHLRLHGRLITDDSYVAMQYGPVPEGTKDIAGLTDFLNPEERDYAARYIRPAGPKKITSCAPVDLDVLSQTDVEALEAVWQHFGTRKLDLVKVTHLFPEWAQRADQVGDGGRPAIPVEAFLEDCGPEAAIFELAPLDPEQRAMLLDELRAATAVRRVLCG